MMCLHHALLKSDVLRLPNLLVKNDVRRLLLLRCYSIDPNQRAKSKLDQKFIESIRRQAEQRKTSQGPVPFVNRTNAQRKEESRHTTKVLGLGYEVPAEGQRLSIWRRIVNRLNTLLELGVYGRRPDAFFFYRDQMSSADNLLVYANESSAYLMFGWPFVILIPALAYRFIQLYRKEAHLSLDGQELDFNLEPWQMVTWIGIYVLIFAFFVTNLSKTVSSIYFNQQTKLFTLCIYRMPFVWRIMKNNKLVVGVGEASECTSNNPVIQFFRPNTKLKNSMVNIDSNKFIKPVYENLLYGRTRKGYQVGGVF